MLPYIFSKWVCHCLQKADLPANHQDSIKFLSKEAGVEQNLYWKIQDDSYHCSCTGGALFFCCFIHLYPSRQKGISYNVKNYNLTCTTLQENVVGMGWGYCQCDSFFLGHSVPGFCQLHQYPSRYRDLLVMLFVQPVIPLLRASDCLNLKYQ